MSSLVLFNPAQKFDAVIDVSHWDNKPDFVKAKNAGIAAVFIKATQGATEVDPMWGSNILAAHAATLLAAPYHFITSDDPEAQAINFMNVANPGEGAPVMIDWEDTPYGTATLEQVITFGKAVTLVTGRAPLLYCGRDQLAAPNAVLNSWPLMLAEYGNDPICPPGWSQWLFHQYTDEGRINGFADAVDRSVFAGTSTDLTNWWLGQNTTVPVENQPPVVKKPTPKPTPVKKKPTPVVSSDDDIADELNKEELQEEGFAA